MVATPDGEMSNLLHNEVQVGDEVVLSAPFGDVVLEYTDRPVVLASAGIGITPMAGMLSHLVKSGSQRQVMLLHADDSPASFPLRAQVTEDLAQLPDGSLSAWFLEPAASGADPATGFQGFMDVTAVDLPEDAEYYLCGPLPFLQSVRSALVAKGVPAKRHPIRGLWPGPLAGGLPVAPIGWSVTEPAQGEIRRFFSRPPAREHPATPSIPSSGTCAGVRSALAGG